MSSADFRTWRRSVEDWLTLNAVSDADAVCYIRLLCAPAVQRALDARFPRARWEALSPSEALNSVSKLVLQQHNQAVCWADFISAMQSPGESLREYFTKCTQKAVDCEFQCPECNGDISEYMLLRKLVAGLREPALRREVFQEVDRLRAYCVAYEAAHRDATWSLCGMQGTVDVTEDAINKDDIIAATHAETASQGTRRCAYCSGRHLPSKTSCPAAGATGRACGKLGHFRRVCQSVKNHMKKGRVASGVIASSGVTSQPQ